MHSWSTDHERAFRLLCDLARDRLRTSKDLSWGADSVLGFEAILRESVTEEGLGLDRAADLFREVVVPSCSANDHPAMLAYVPSAPTVEARMLDMALGAINTFAGHWEAGAGAIEAENSVLSWLASLAGLPRTAGGTFVTGGSAANLSALVAARHQWRAQRPAEPTARLTICASRDAHASVLAAARVMDVDVVDIPTDAAGRIEVRALADAFTGESASRTIFAVVATAGTTALGAVDDLVAVGAVARRHGAWLHVDAAYGGGALCSRLARARLRGIEEADSIGISAHKWLFAPYDCAALLYRDPEQGRQAHAQQGGYLDSIDRDAWNPADLAFHLSRRPRGLPLWFSLVANGAAAYGDAVDATIRLARELALDVYRRPYLRLLLEPDLSVVVVERQGWQPSDYHRWAASWADTGRGVVAPLRWGGRTYVRLCIVNPLTTVEMLGEVLDSLH